MAQEYKLILKYADEPGYSRDIECYLRHGGYNDLKKALAISPKDLPDGKKLSPQEQIREDVKVSGLRGRGGAGFSCGLSGVSLTVRAASRFISSATPTNPNPARSRIGRSCIRIRTS